jgi:hypothetical protein
MLFEPLTQAEEDEIWWQKCLYYCNRKEYNKRYGKVKKMSVFDFIFQGTVSVITEKKK